MPANYALILAGGRGLRMGPLNVPKQFAALAGRPMLVYPLQAAQSNKHIDFIGVVAPPQWHERIRQWGREYGISKLHYMAESGQERRQSVHNGLHNLPARPDDTVMIMTAVCPFISRTTIDKHFEAMQKHEACITVVKATDAITFSRDGQWADRTLQKKNVFIQQGPQTFKYGIIKSAHELYESGREQTEVNEDSELVLNMGVKTFMIFGDRFCIKITYPEDLCMAEALSELFSKSQAGPAQHMEAETDPC
jgi:2-C-methyl-D-erythritol 4-phosphate cytidylyltransferase